MDEQALYQMTYGLYVVCAADGGEKSGCVVNTLQQVTAQPVKLAVTVNKENYTAELIGRAKRFAAVALDQRATLPDIGRFGFRTGRDFDKFEGIDTAQDESGIPYPTGCACAFYSCRLMETVDLGTHLMFIGEVQQAEKLSEEPPLTYAYYRTVIKGKTPKNAPSYHEGQ